MQNINYPRIIKKDWRKMLVIVLAVILITLILTLIQPFQYRSTVSILVLQKSSFSIDAYSASKSEERIANKLAQVVYSSSFLEKVLNSGYNIERSYFPNDEQKRRKKWDQTVETEAPVGLSKLDIALYHSDPNQALALSRAVAYTLTAEKQEYIGIADVDLRVLDAPLVSKYPVRPNVFLNLLLGLLVGLALGAAYVIVGYRPGKEMLFTSPEPKEIEPELIETDEAPADEFGGQPVEAEMEKMGEVPEIDDLDEIEDDSMPDRN